MAVSKRLLAVAWMMPPLVFPRSLQISRTLKILSQRGWQCDVITVHPEDIVGTSDKNLASLYLDYYTPRYVPVWEDVIRTPFLQRLSRRLNPPNRLDEDNFLRRGWPLAVSLLDGNPFDGMATFGQPWIDHILGLKIKQSRPNMPWVAHFSDPWSDSPYAKVPPNAEHSASLSQRQEKAVIETADSLVFVTDETAELVMRKYSPRLRSKVHVVPHGYDSDLLAAIKPIPRQENRLYMVYTGSFYPDMRMPTELLHAIKKLNETHDARDRLVVDFIGFAPDECRQLAESLGLFGQTRFLGAAGYMTSLGAAASADVLLLIDAPSENSVFLPSKIVDYLMSRKPIVALTPFNGASIKALEQCGHQFVAPPDDRVAIHTVLVSVLESWRTGNLHESIRYDAIEKFDIRITAQKFEDVLLKTIEASA